LVSGRPVVSGGLAARGGESIHLQSRERPEKSSTYKDGRKRRAREQAVKIGS